MPLPSMFLRCSDPFPGALAPSVTLEILARQTQKYPFQAFEGGLGWRNVDVDVALGLRAKPTPMAS